LQLFSYEWACESTIKINFGCKSPGDSPLVLCLAACSFRDAIKITAKKEFYLKSETYGNNVECFILLGPLLPRLCPLYKTLDSISLYERADEICSKIQFCFLLFILTRKLCNFWLSLISTRGFVTFLCNKFATENDHYTEWTNIWQY